jgi:acyl-coenzyme A thioesterase PaaI-like protein
VIPFNRPHGFELEAIGDEFIRTRARYRKGNFNHIRGIHACAIATIAEFSAGFLLLSRLDPARYRLIMSELQVEYTYQAKEDIFSESRCSGERLLAEVITPLEQQELVTVKMESRVFDGAGNGIALAHTTWQIKRWDKVKTKL